MPAVFGMIWQPGIEYYAHLQFLPDHIFLCNNEDITSLSSDANGRLLSHRNNQTTHPTSDGLPVVLLVSRGGCSFEEKARNAMKIDLVKYLIVCDDRVRPSPFTKLVPMSATNPTNVDVGMLFVSYTSGMKLITMIHDQFQNVTDAGGLVIKMDSVAPNLPYGPSEGQQWVLAAMAGFFTFLACFACLLMCVHAGILPSDRNHGTFGRLARTGSILLSEEQVTALPLQEYKANIEAGNQTSCAICLEEYEQGEKLRQLACGHCFHHDCIKPWLTERSASCPLCKLEVTVHGLSGNVGASFTAINPWWWRRSNWTYRSILPLSFDNEITNNPAAILETVQPDATTPLPSQSGGQRLQ